MSRLEQPKGKSLKKKKKDQTQLILYYGPFYGVLRCKVKFLLREGLWLRVQWLSREAVWVRDVADQSGSPIVL